MITKIQLFLSLFFFTLALCVFPYVSAIKTAKKVTKPPSMDYLKKYTKEQIENLLYKDYPSTEQ